MAATDAVSLRSPVRSELLCFVYNKASILAFDAIVDICADFYKLEEIEEARVLLTCYSSKQRMPKHKGNATDKKKRTLADIVKVCLDPDTEVPIFYATDLARVPPVGVQHIDVSALLQEVAALRAEVRAAIAVKEEIASVRAAVASLASSSLAVENDTAADVGVPTVDVSGARSAASIVKDAIRSGVLQSGNVSRQSVVRAGVGKSAPRSKPVVGSSSTNSHVKGVETYRDVDIFVSRLHPSTNVNELVDCLNTIKGELSVKNIDCKKLVSKYEHLYSSYHATVTVDSSSFYQAIKLFTAAEAWPVGIFVRRYFKTRSATNGDPQ